MTRPPLVHERAIAIRLARRHPGWSTGRIGREVCVDRESVRRWLGDENLAPANPRVRRGDGPRAEAVELTCGHLGVPPYSRSEPEGWCWTCRAYVPLGKAPRLEHEARLELAELRRTPPLEPDTVPTLSEWDLHFADLRVSTVLGDLLERLRDRE
jgi:hypothetical protein